MLRKATTALTKQVVHVDHAEQAAFFVSNGQHRDRFAFHELKKRGDRIALGPAAGEGVMTVLTGASGLSVRGRRPA